MEIEEEESEQNKVCFVPFVKWVKKGVAKSNPEKIQLTKEELEEIIKATKNKLQISAENEDASTSQTDEFNLENYDEEDENVELGIASIAQLPADNVDNFHDDDVDSDNEDDIIKPEDNLILAAKIDGDASIIEVYVYNESEGSLYCHHDILLSSYPLCIEWLDHEPNQMPGNYCAVSVMNSTIIDIWDLDLINSLEPAYTLGEDKKAHKGDILDLAWNSNFNHILASCGIDKKINLWDLDTGEPSSKIKAFEGNVQCMKWHRLEAQTLLAGSADKTVKVFDCRNIESFLTWQVDGEVEKVCWHPLKPYSFFVGTGTGLVAHYDCRQGLLWSMPAHSDEVSGIGASAQCPGLLVTTSVEGGMKVWDIDNNASEGTTPTLVHEKDMKVGVVHTMQLSPESPFTVAVGGDNKSHNFSVLDLMGIDVVKHHFGSRELIQLVEAEENSATTT